jgi:CheY-like chemotaxis protein
LECTGYFLFTTTLFSGTSAPYPPGPFQRLVFDEAWNGTECLQMMQDVAPEILFIDVHLHDEDGIDLLRNINKLSDHDPDCLFRVWLGGV